MNHLQTIHLTSWSQFLRLAEKVNIGKVGAPAYVFRGQSDAAWELKPSLLRYFSTDLGAQNALDLENDTLVEFKSQAHLHLPQSVFATTTDSISWLTAMQHHGAPTRMLDWTGSIYVAAYFAVHGKQSSDGAIWLVHTESVNSYMKRIYGDSDSEMPTNENAIRKSFFVSDALKNLIFVGRQNKSDRMIAQQGLFSVSRDILGDHGAILSEVFTSPSEDMLFAKLIIPQVLKASFAKHLQAMNITANALFPGIDGLGRSLAELVQIASLSRG